MLLHVSSSTKSVRMPDLDIYVNETAFQSRKMNLERCHLSKELRTARLESMELRRKLHELKTEFIQLRKAYEINLRTQKHREIRFSLLTHENQEIRGFGEKCLRNITKMQDMLKNAENERHFWKGRIQDMKEAETRRNEIEILEESAEKDHVDISKTEERIRLTELSKLYDEATEKIRRLEEKTIEGTRQREFFVTRTQELANLLTTLEDFDLDAKILCRLTATAIENLTEVGLSFEETVKKLRQFTWKVDNRKSATEVDTLRSQNLILREIVKSLKRKAQFRTENQSSGVECSKQEEEEEKYEKKIEECNEPYVTKVDICQVQKSNKELSMEREESLQEQSKLFVNGPTQGTCLWNGQRNINEKTKCSETLPAVNYFENNKDIVSRVNGKVSSIEPNTNEIFFEEYVIRFSNSGQMKIKHSPEASAKAAHLKLEFLDSEDKYQESTPDKIVILLKNLCASIKIGHTSINCNSHTMLTQKYNNNTRTSIAEKHDFPRLKAGYTILNSEKRAIERNLSNLERTVADLKSNTLHHARSMIGKKYTGNDQFFDCIERLAGD